ncbi:MAG: diguanylate cyclase [Armatimonadota bacterium]
MDHQGFYKDLVDNLEDGVCFCDRERRITYWNSGAERISGLSASEVVGSRFSEEILTHVDERGRLLSTDECPLDAALADGDPRKAQAYLCHKQGHPIPVEARIWPLRDDEGRVVGAAELFTDNSPVVAAALQHVDALRQMAYVDPVTGLSNRRHAVPILQARLEELQRYGWQFAVLLFDVDGFKEINDGYGHEIGDHVLKMVGQALEQNCRSSDFVARWGGDEFVGVLPIPEPEKLPAAGERFRLLVESCGLPLLPETLRVTVSVGATMARLEDTAEGLVDRADELMYQSKTGGGNSVTVG